MRDVLVIIDLLNDFGHEDGDRLLRSFKERAPALRDALERARGSDVPVVYVNDRLGSWSGDRSEVIRRALEGQGGDEMEPVAPQEDEPLLLKARYSAFDHTALELLLRELEAERLLLAGGATEACVVQTGIDARELGFKVTILTAACWTIDEETEQVALRYAEDVAGIRLSADVGVV